MLRDVPSARREAIGARLAGGLPVGATALAAEFGVSEDAIRRDLRALAVEGRCRRVYGGALPISDATATMAARADRATEAKRQLARAGAATIRPGELVFLDSGSTNLAMVEALPEDPDLTVATNAPEIAASVLRRQDLRLIVVGGLADAVVGGCVDAAAAEAVTRMRIDRAFIGACSVSADGLGAFNFADASFKRAAIAVARRTLVLATADKLLAQTPHRVVALSRVDLVVIEPDTTPEQRAALRDGGCGLLVAD